MADLLFHIDSRCLHGQVVAGWGFSEGIGRFVLANDEVAADEWERGQYLNAPGKEFETLVLSIADAVAWLKQWARGAEQQGSGRKTMLVVSSPRDGIRILNGSIRKIELITIGNLDPGPGKQRLAPTVYADANDLRALQEILNRGIRVLIKPLPNSTPIAVADLLRRVDGKR